MLTDLELKAKSLAAAMVSEPQSFGASQAAIALGHVSKLAKANQCDDATADRVRVFLGNHSAVRQWLVKHAFIVEPADALTNALSEEIAKLKEAEVEELEKLSTKKA